MKILRVWVSLKKKNDEWISMKQKKRGRGGGGLRGKKEEEEIRF